MRSYFGGVLCLCWSPDGCYVVTGGEDDLVTVWSFHHKRVVARGVGHQSYVSAVAFDPYTTVLPETLPSDTVSSPVLDGPVEDTSSVAGKGSARLRNSGAFDGSSAANSPFLGRLTSEAGREKEVMAYRLGSVGQDSHLCLWDLSEDALKIRRLFARSRSSRPSRMMSGYYQQPPHSSETSSLRQRSNGDEKMSCDDRGEDIIARPRSDALDQETHRELAGAVSQEGTTPPQPSTEPTNPGAQKSSHTVDTDRLLKGVGEREQKRKSDSQGRESQEKEASPAVSDASSGEKKNGKKTKNKGGKKQIRAGQQKSLREPMKRVMKFVGIGGQHHNGRREVSAFETCNSDDIAPKMEEVNVIEPLVAEQVDRERLSDLVFRDDCILIASYDGCVSLWARPGVERGGEEGGDEGGEAAVGSTQEPPGEESSDKPPPETHPGVSMCSL